jgi:hypothetical protein
MLDDIYSIRQTFAGESKPYKAVSSRNNNTYSALVFNQDNYYLNVGNKYCHGFLNDSQIDNTLRGVTGRVKKSGFRCLLSMPMKSLGTAERTRDFYLWLINNSPWAHTHLDKDVDRCMDLGFVVDMSLPGNVVLSGLMASRLYYEAYDTSLQTRIAIYEEAVDGGLDKLEAFLLCHIMSRGPYKRYPMSAARVVAGHSIFLYQNTNEGYYRNFLSGNFVNLSPPITPHRGYESYGEVVTTSWGKPSKRDDFFRWVEGVRPCSGEEKENFNIFFQTCKEVSYKICNRNDLLSVWKQVKERIYA